MTSFFDMVDRAAELVAERGKVSLRGLELEFQTDRATVDAIVTELVDVRGCARVEGELLAAVSQPPARVQREYTPRHLAEKIRRSRFAIEGERKHVTVFFSDIVRSTELAAELGDEEWHLVLDDFFAIMSEAVHHYEGTVNQYTGDGIMALFGAPVAHEDHAQRACLAALRVRERLEPFIARLARQGIDFSTRIGLNSGHVVVGSIGDDLRMDYTAQGQVVNLAKRMEAAAPPGEIYLSESTMDFVRGRFAVRDLEPIQVKGLRAPIRVGSLGEEIRETRFGVARSAGLSSFIGRRAEIDQLTGLLDGYRAGGVQAAAVVGEAGVGKTRLVTEFLQQAVQEGRVVETACHAHTQQFALHTIRDLLRQLFGLQPRESIDDLDRVLVRAGLDPGAFSPAELQAAASLVGSAQPETDSPGQESDRFQTQLSLLERVLASTGGAILSVHDLQWMDVESVQLLSALANSPNAGRLLILLTARPEFSGWRGALTRIELNALQASDAAALVGSLVGDDPSVASVQQKILAATGGNPFFLEETVRSLVATGQLTGEAGAYRRTGELEAVAIPATVESTLAARIDLLGDDEKYLLQVASVLGQELDQTLLAEVAGIEPARLQGLIGTLMDQALFRGGPDTADLEFEHALTREVAYASQLRAQRQKLHAAAAEILESSATETAEDCTLIAHHWAQANEPVKAARQHSRAIRLLGYDYPMSLGHHGQRMVELLEDAPLDDEVIALRLEGEFIELTSGVAHLGYTAEQARNQYERASRFARKVGDHRALARIERGYALASVLLDDIPGGDAHYRAAIDIALEINDQALADRLNQSQWYCAIRYMMARFDEVLAAVEQALPGSSPQARPHLLRERGLNRAYTGDLSGAREDFEEALTSEPGVNIERHLESNVPHLAWFLGDGEMGLQHARRSLELAQQQGSKYYVVEARLAEGLGYLAGGRWREATELLEELLAPGAEVQTSEGQDFVRSLLAEAYIELGRTDEALELCEQVIETSLNDGRRRAAIHAMVMKAKGLAAAGPAEDAFEAAVSTAEHEIRETGANGYLPFLLEARAIREGSETAAQAAAEAFMELGAPLRAERCRARAAR